MTSALFPFGAPCSASARTSARIGSRISAPCGSSSTRSFPACRGSRPMRAELTLEHSVQRIEGPLLFLERKVEIGLNARVDVLDHDGRERIGRVAAIDERAFIIEVLESTAGLG